MYESFQKDMPWILIIYLMTDAEVYVEKGQSRALLECCICGEVQRVEFHIPPDDDPIWETILGDGLPEVKEILDGFKSRHIHEDKHENPMLQWKLPLRNPAALKHGISIVDLKLRLSLEGRRNGGRDPF